MIDRILHFIYILINRKERKIMKKDNAKLAASILEFIGGKNNVSHVMHCATRLRFTLKDESLVQKEKIKNEPGVIDLIIQNGQYQVCIGPDVANVFKEVQKLGAGNNEGPAPQSKKKGVDRFFEIISGIFTPIVPILMAAGMVGALLTVLNLCGILPETSPTYYVWDCIREAGFYFLPMYIAYTASQKLGASPFLSMLLAGTMLVPKLTAFDAIGVEQLSFFGLPIKTVSYSNTVLPIILGVWLLSYVEKLFNKVLPDLIKAFGVPMLTMMIVVPVELIIIGPAGAYLADYMAAFVEWMGSSIGFFAVGILAALTPIMIATGTHSFAFPVIVTTLAMNGHEALIVPAMLAENLAMAGAAFAVGISSKDKNVRAESNAAVLSACLGISEPAMYGINLPRKAPFYASIIGSGIGGIIAGLLGIRFYAIASASFVGLPATVGEGSVSGVWKSLIVIAVSFTAAFFFTFILDKGYKTKKSASKTVPAYSSKETLSAPATGEVIDITAVNDSTFSSKAMGDGVAIKPARGEIFAPADGTISMVFPTGHAFGFKTKSGMELLIHIGLETVNENGKGFNIKIKEGQSVKSGDILVQFDLEDLKQLGYDMTTMIVVTDMAEHKTLQKVTGSIKAGEPFIIAQ